MRSPNSLPALILALSVSTTTTSHGQLAELVAELETGRTEIEEHSDPRDFAAREREAFFIAREIQGPTLLWRTDGSPEGTQAVFSEATEIVAVDDDDIFFLRETELWWSNGRADGTADHRLLGEIGPILTDVRFADDAGAIFFLSFFEGQSSILRASKFGITVLGETASPRGNTLTEDALIFFDTDGIAWRSDGTVDGTFSLGQPPNPINSGQRSLAVSGSTVYWMARVNSELQLWRTDGSAEGTSQIDLGTLGLTLEFGALQTEAGRLFFVASGDIKNYWSIANGEDFPSQETFLKLPDALYSVDTSSNDPSYLRATSDGLFFLARDRNDDIYIWFTRWGQSTARQILFLCRGCSPSRGIFLESEASGVLFQVASSDPDLWFSDGTDSSTRRILTCDRECGSFIEGVGFTLAYRTPNGHLSLVRIDASNGAVETLADNPPVEAGAIGGVVLGTKLLTVGETGSLREPVFIDFATGESGDLGDLAHAYRSPPALMSTEGSELFFTYRIGSPEELQVGTTDGSATQLLGHLPLDCRATYRCIKKGSSIFNGSRFFDVVTGEISSIPELSSDLLQLAKLSSGRFVFYRHSEGEVWSTDATPEGTFLLQGEIGSYILSDEHSYVAAVRTNGDWVGLMVTDGTEAGTKVFPIDDFVFDFRRTAMSREWIYLGTNASLIRVAREDGRVENLTSDLPTGPTFRIASAGAAVEIFLGNDRQAERYRLDDGDRVFRFQNTVSPEVSDRMNRQFHSVHIPGKTLISTGDFLLELEDLGAYTEHRRDVFTDLFVVSDSAYFVSDSRYQGMELWTVSPASQPRLVHDIWPGPRSSRPRNLKAANDRLFFAADDGLHGPELWVLDTQQESCSSTQFTLCLQNDRFKVDTWWKSFDDTTGRGHAVPVTSDTGAFWFFNPENLESVVKSLDGRSINGYFWTFFGSLSNVEFALTVTDSASGKARRYTNQEGTFASVGDVTSLNELLNDTSAFKQAAAGAAVSLLRPTAVLQETAGTCRSGPTYLCLRDGAFEVSVEWEDFDSGSGSGVARPIVEDTGAFWFFNSDNIELAIKVLDGTSINNHYWVFFASLSNVAFTVRVRETTSGAVRVYENPIGNFASLGDVVAFAQ